MKYCDCMPERGWCCGDDDGGTVNLCSAPQSLFTNFSFFYVTSVHVPT